jgi:hypothetical protein
MPKSEASAAASSAPADLAKARAAFSAYKGHFTCALQVFDRQVALVLVAKPTPQAVAALETAHEDFLIRYSKMSKALDDNMDATIAAGEDSDRTIAECDALYDDYSKVEEVYMDANLRLSRQIRRAQAPAATPAVAAPVAAGANVGFREAKGLKPCELYCTDTHVALREWIASYRCYYDASKFDQATDAMRHNYIYTCLESKLARCIRSAATATSAVLNPVNCDPDPTSLETLLSEQFDAQDSVFAHRYRLMGKRHQQGTRFTD